MSQRQILLERNEDLEKLARIFEAASKGAGQTVFVMGEAGIGKTSLVKTFLENVRAEAVVYVGSCDSLFSARPLGPLIDIATYTPGELLDVVSSEKDRGVLFALFLQKFFSSPNPVVVLFEDIHWADEATLDFVKLLSRRIQNQKCLFLLTFRDDEVGARHPLKHIAAEMPTGSFTKLFLRRLTEQAVVDWSIQCGSNSGKDIFKLTQGNPFYVTEVLASNENGDIPERVKDSILSVFYSKPLEIQSLWEILSIMPSGIDVALAEKIGHDFPRGIEEGVASGVLILKKDGISFKHELYRITIEGSISTLRKKTLHSQMIKMINELHPDAINLSHLIHHALYADDRDLIRKVAPRAAREAAAVGAHIESSKLFSIAIQYSDSADESIVELYERHAYECYLTNQIESAISSQRKALDIWRQRKVVLKIGDTLRFLSRLLWFHGRSEEVDEIAVEAVQVLENGFPTRERAMAYSNLSQLYMLSGNSESALYWGQKAIELATRMEDQEILSHALNNVGSVLLTYPDQEKEGIEKLNRSLQISLENHFHEHAARAYTNLCSMSVTVRQYSIAEKYFKEGIYFCEQHDLNSWTYYLQSEEMKMMLDIGNVSQAEEQALKLYSNNSHTKMVRIAAISVLAKIYTRRGDFSQAKELIKEGMILARPTNEAMRIVPMLTTWIELCWLTQSPLPEDEIRKADETLFPQKIKSWYYSDFIYWVHKAGMAIPGGGEKYNGPFREEVNGEWKMAVTAWEKVNCSYQQAIALFQLSDKEKKQAVILLKSIGATATAEFFVKKMKECGIKNIPRKPHESTLSNPALLTVRQKEILMMLREGFQNKEIAEKLFISLKTVDAHVSAILSKLEVTNRSKAVAEAQRLKIIN